MIFECFDNLEIAELQHSVAALRQVGIQPDAVTDIIVSHSHWDHADGVDLFPRAKVWIQKEEYEYYVGDHGEVLIAIGIEVTRARPLGVSTSPLSDTWPPPSG